MTISNVAENTVLLDQVPLSQEDFEEPAAEFKVSRAAGILYESHVLLTDLNSFVRNTITAIGSCVSSLGASAKVVAGIAASTLAGGIQLLITGTKLTAQFARESYIGYREKNHKKMAEGATMAVAFGTFTSLGGVMTKLGVDSLKGVSSAGGLTVALSTLGFVFYSVLTIYSIVKIIEKYSEYKNAVSHTAKVEAHKELVRNILLLLVSVAGIIAFALMTAATGPAAPILFAICAAPLWTLLDSSVLFDKFANWLAPKMTEKQQDLLLSDGM